MKKIQKGVIAVTLSCLLQFSSINAVAQGDPTREYFTIPDYIQKTYYLGEEVSIAKILPTDSNAQGYEYTVLDKDNTIVTLDGRSFRPTKEGEYKCIYSYLLDGKQYDYVYTLKVLIKEKPVFVDEPNFPNAFIAGKTYSLPMLSAIDYSSSTPKTADVTVSVTCAGQSVDVQNNTFTLPENLDGSDAVIRYTAVSDGKTEILERSIPITKVYYTQEGSVRPSVDLTNLFVRDGFYKADATEDALVFSTSGNAEASYANKISANGFEIDFGFGENDSAECVELTLQSYDDPDVSISIAFYKGKQSEGTGKIVLNGKTEKAFTFTKNKKLKVSFNAMSKQLLGEDKTMLFNINEDINGEVFNGFTGGFIKAKLAVKGNYGSCDLKIYKINTQQLTNASKEGVSPALYREDAAIEYNVGDIITLPTAYAVDVVDPCATLTVTVKLGSKIIEDVNGEPIKDKSGEVSFVAKEAGVYSLRYTVNDSSNNSNTLGRSVYVSDNQAPTLEIKGDIDGQVKVGKTLKIPELKVSDNNGSMDTSLLVCIVRPDGHTVTLGTNMQRGLVVSDTVTNASYKFTHTGKHYLRIIATDAYGNFVKKEYLILCEG